jgi:SAM-dependent methyltransferase
MRALDVCYYITILLSGASVMILEILGTRVAAPFFGTSHFVWTAQLLITLLSMSIGYLLSERLDVLRPWVLFVSIVVAAMYLILDAAFYSMIGSLLLTVDLKLGCLLFSSIIFGPPLIILSMTFPFLYKVLASSSFAYRIGMVSALSTAGSICGTLAVGYVLVPLYSNRAMLLGTACVLIADAFVFFVVCKMNPLKLTKVKLVFYSMLSLQILLTCAQLVLASGTKSETKDLLLTNSFWGELRVMETSARNRFLLNDLLIQNSYDPVAKKSTALFTYALESLAIRYSPVSQGKALCIGLGVGIVPSTLKKNGFSVDIVEINTKLIPVATEYFDFIPQSFRIALVDGRFFINTTKETYDVIVLDAFIGDSVPSHLLSAESFSEMKRILNPGGILVINSFGWLDSARAAFSSSFARTISSVFGSVRAFSLGDGNIYFIAGSTTRALRDYDLTQVPGALSKNLQRLFRSPVRPDSAASIIFTDDYNPADIMDAKNREQWRHAVAQSMRF